MLSDSEGEDLTQFTINEHFAKAYAHRKEREELQKLKDKYGSDAELDEEEEDSEDLETEDEDGEELTPAVDVAILRTLARIKGKDPAIYEKDAAVFEEEREKLGTSQPVTRRTKDKSAPLTLRQQAIDSVLNPRGSRSPSPQPLTHVEEQRALRSETISAFHHAAAAREDEDEDELLVPREKTKDELEREEEEYRAFLEREVGQDLKTLVTIEGDSVKVGDGDGIEEGKKKKKGKKERIKEKEASQGQAPRKSKEEEDHEFLMNYILNRGWIDRQSRRIPTYGELTGDNKRQQGKPKVEIIEHPNEDEDTRGGVVMPDATLDYEAGEDDEFEDVVDKFESSYNFRFEEPDGADIKRYPRNVQSTVRREDTTRKEAREKRKARKEEEVAKKREEIARLKALKMRELRSKLERIGREGGKSLDHDEALQVLDLDADWDPEAHDRQMAGIYRDLTDGGGEGEYDNEQGEGDVDAEKPIWDDDIDIDDIVPVATTSKKKKDKKKKKVSNDETNGVDIDAMDADVERDIGEDEWDGTEEMRKRVLDKYMDEVYGLEFNDMVGDLTTRFKYTPVQADSFALNPAEILMATDAELNSYVGLRQVAPYREGRRWDTQRNDRLKQFRTALHSRGVIASTDKHGVAQLDGGETVQKRRKGKKERQKEKAAVAQKEAVETPQNVEDGDEDEPAKKKRKRKHKKAETF